MWGKIIFSSDGQGTQFQQEIGFFFCLFSWFPFILSPQNADPQCSKKLPGKGERQVSCEMWNLKADHPPSAQNAPSQGPTMALSCHHPLRSPFLLLTMRPGASTRKWSEGGWKRVEFLLLKLMFPHSPISVLCYGPRAMLNLKT